MVPYTITKDLNGERFALQMVVGETAIRLSGLHVSTTPQQIDNVVQGAVLFATSPSSLLASLSQPPLLTPKTSPNSTLEQITGLKQWHSNACGYYALYNARCMLLGAEPSSEVALWQLTFTYMDLLAKRWPHADFTNMLMDDAHVAFLVESDPALNGGNCELISNPEWCVGVPVIPQGKRHAYLLACASHWISAVWTGENVLTVMDSHNKPLSKLDSAQRSADLAQQAVEDYRSEFCFKMAEIPKYEHHSAHLLNNLYDTGVPEYWKGRVKDSLYWAHRPAIVRLGIMYRELECTRACLDFLLQRPPQRLLPKRVLLPDALNVFTNLTSQHAELNAYVRREEDLPVLDSAVPATVENRKRAPLREIKGDVFDRQRTIPGFDQGKIESQICLVVGTGGIGMNVALTLCRLGVLKICLVDYDTYDASNLTRQCLGTKLDVGESKTSVAVRNIQAHNLRTTVEALDVNVVTEWPQVVQAAKRCTVIFNCCDAGKMLDFALNSLAKELVVPYCSGQSFGWKFMSEFYTGHPELNCAFCEESTRSTFSLSRPDWAFDRLCATYGGDFAQMLEQDEAFRIDPKSIQRFCDETALELPCGTTLGKFTQTLERYHDWAVAQLLPGRVSLCESLSFCPWPKPVSTRYVGSWVCPCLACGVFCVSHWSNRLTSPNRNPPTTMLFNMDEGMTSEEQQGYEFQLDKRDRSFANTPSRTACQVCLVAKQLDCKRGLYFGTDKAFLRPVPGDVSKSPNWDFDYAYTAQDKQPRPSPRTGELLEPRVPAAAPPRFRFEEPQTLQDWPSSFAFAPVVKTSEEDAKEWPGSIQGVASGVRSAIVFESTRALRLKGCGNRDQGFPLEVKGEDQQSKSVRGCMFEDTCARELYMTQYLRERCGVRLGNHPLGYFCYAGQLPPYPNPRWSWEAADTGKFCAVFETFGERRLGDGLLAGMEQVLCDLVRAAEPLQKQRWLALLQPQMEARGSRFDTATQVECGLACVDFSAAEFDDNELTLLLELGRELGKECGEIMQQLAQHNVCWGTFPDEMGIHCNAHANNLVVLMDPQPLGKFLGAVDFDFSFTLQAYFDGGGTWQGKETFFPRDFAGIVEFEQTMGMKTSLAGCNFSSTGVDNQQNHDDNDECYQMLKIAFRDSVVVGYEHALAGPTTDPKPPAWIQLAQHLVEKALKLGK